MSDYEYGYGKELILDLHECNPERFTREWITLFLMDLCRKIGMKREDLHFWDYLDDPEGYNEAPKHLRGTSAVQFITTSNITIHTLDELKSVYINLFSCSDFNAETVSEFAAEWFKGKVVNQLEVDRA